MVGARKGKDREMKSTEKVGAERPVRWKFRPLALIALAFSVIAATACGAGSGQSSGSGDEFLLGIVSISASESNNARFISGAKEVAKEKDWKVEVVDADGSAEKANTAMRNFVQKDAGAIIDMVFPVTSIGAGLAATKQADIPVATWGGGVDDGVVATTGAGGPLAVPIVEMMVEEMDGEGSVLALTYRSGLVCREREEVFDKVMADHPNIEVTKNEVGIPGFFQDGAQYATAWLSGNPSGSGNLAIWGCWDDPALGAISGLKQRGREDVQVYGQNGNQEAINAVENGSMTATNYQNSTEEGRKLVQTIDEAIKAGDGWKPKNVEVPGTVVTSDNIDQFLKENPKAGG